MFENSSTVQLMALLLAALLPSSASAQIAQYAVPLADNTSKVYVAAELSYEELQTPRIYPVDALVSAPNLAEQQVLDFYRAAKSNNTALLLDTALSEDGTKAELAEKLKVRPNMFEGFRGLETVSVTARLKWGAYDVFHILLAGEGQTLPWRNLALCNVDKCRHSNFVNLATSSRRVFNLVDKMLPAYLRSGGWTTQFRDRLAAAKNANKQLVLNPEYLPLSSDSAPMTLYFNLEIPTQSQFNINGLNEPQPTGEILELISMLTAVVQTDDANLEDTLKRHWTSVNPVGTLSMATEKPGATRQGELIKAEFSWPAFKQRIGNWKQIRVLGIARTDELHFVFVEPSLGETAVDSVQLYTIAYRPNEAGYRLVADIDNILPAAVLGEAVVLEFVAASYRK